MSKPRRSVTLQVESLEEKTAPSSLVPVLTQHTFNRVLRDIDRAGGTFAKTRNAQQFEAKLFQIASRVPFGRAELFPTWQDTESIYSPSDRGSGMVMINELKGNFVAYVQAGVQSGSFRFR